MATILDDHFMVCIDCLMIIANDDASGLDYHLDEAEAAAREQEIQRSIVAHSSEGHLAVGNSAQDEEFSFSPCDCCNFSLAGSRHHCVLMS